MCGTAENEAGQARRKRAVANLGAKVRVKARATIGATVGAKLGALRAKGPLHTSLGQRPRNRIANRARAESPSHHARKRAWIGLSALGCFPSRILGRCPRLVWRRAFGPERTDLGICIIRWPVRGASAARKKQASRAENSRDVQSHSREACAEVIPFLPINRTNYARP